MTKHFLVEIRSLMLNREKTKTPPLQTFDNPTLRFDAEEWRKARNICICTIL